MKIRKYNQEKDKEAVLRVFKEVGWVRSEKDEKALNVFMNGCETIVAEIRGEAEAVVQSTPGRISYLGEELDISVIIAVVVSRVARKMKLASKATAQAVKNQL